MDCNPGLGTSNILSYRHVEYLQKNGYIIIEFLIHNLKALLKAKKLICPSENQISAHFLILLSTVEAA
jgi:hypothetical protein